MGLDAAASDQRFATVASRMNHFRDQATDLAHLWLFHATCSHSRSADAQTGGDTVDGAALEVAGLTQVFLRL